MASLISGANSLPLQANKGYSGVEYFLIADKTSVVLTPDDETGFCDIEASGELVLTDEFKRVDPVKDSASLIDTHTGTRTTGANSHKPVALFSYQGHSNDVRLLVEALKKTNSIVVGVYWDGTAKIAGHRTGLTLVSEVDTSGQAPDDLSGSTVTLEGSEPNKMYLVDSDVLATLQA